jgi:hypothetical protein
VCAGLCCVGPLRRGFLFYSILFLLEQVLEAARGWQARADVLLHASTSAEGKWQPEACSRAEDLSAVLAEPPASLLLLPQAQGLRDELGRLALVSLVEGMLASTPGLDEVKRNLEEGTRLGVEHLDQVVELQKRASAASKCG